MSNPKNAFLICSERDEQIGSARVCHNGDTLQARACASVCVGERESCSTQATRQLIDSIAERARDGKRWVWVERMDEVLEILNDTCRRLELFY